MVRCMYIAISIRLVKIFPVHSDGPQTVTTLCLGKDASEKVQSYYSMYKPCLNSMLRVLKIV